MFSVCTKNAIKNINNILKDIMLEATQKGKSLTGHNALEVKVQKIRL